MTATATVPPTTTTATTAPASQPQLEPELQTQITQQPQSQQQDPIQPPPRFTDSPKIDTIGLTKDLSAPTGPISPHTAADAARAMSSTGAWQPSLDRRQSWSSQEYKHELQKPMQTGLAGEDKPGSGFTERED
jgi:hypothetical protein